MRHGARLALVAAVLLVGCRDPVGPGVPYVGYELLEVDGVPLPTRAGYPEGHLLVLRTLTFSPSFDGWDPDGQHGEVRIRSYVLNPGGTIDIHETNHNWSVRNRWLTIDLCPIGSACITLVPADLSGEVTEFYLTLTESLAGQQRRQYLYRPVLPE